MDAPYQEAVSKAAESGQIIEADLDYANWRPRPDDREPDRTRGSFRDNQTVHKDE